MKLEMAMVKALAHSRQRAAERNRILTAFATNPQGSHRAVTKVTKAILLNSPYTWEEKLYDIKAKSLGAGVYELRAERKEND